MKIFIRLDEMTFWVLMSLKQAGCLALQCHAGPESCCCIWDNFCLAMMAFKLQGGEILLSHRKGCLQHLREMTQFGLDVI